MAGILTFNQFVGGPDSIQIESIFPATQKNLTYNFNQNISGWSFTAKYQTIIVDTVAFDRNSGAPSFTNSKVIGYFPMGTIDSSKIVVNNNSTGSVTLTVPTNMYTGPIIPDARLNVPITVVDFIWNTGGTNSSINSNRWVFIMNWEPGVGMGDPTKYTGYTALGV